MNKRRLGMEKGYEYQKERDVEQKIEEKEPESMQKEPDNERDKRSKKRDKSIPERDNGIKAPINLESIRKVIRRGKEKIHVFRAERRKRRYENGEVELPVFRVGPNKKGVAALWILMGASLAFGVYKNFTAIDRETIRETTVVEAEVTDTNAVESFVERFAYLYHTWDNNYEAKSEREAALAGYLTDALIKVNRGAVNGDCPTRAEVESVRICEVENLEDGDFKVRYLVRQCFKELGAGEETTASVSQNIVPMTATGLDSEGEDTDSQTTDGENKGFQGTQTGENAEDLKEDVPEESGTEAERNGQAENRVELVQDENGVTRITKRESFYLVRVHMDESGSMVITQNPTVCGIPGKSSYAPVEMQNDGSVDVSVMKEVEDFLNTFFTLYPAATEKELVYYVKAGAMDVINADFIYDGLRNAVYYMDAGQIKAHVYVRYLDQTAKIAQVSEYTLTLEKGDNWKIIKAE